MVNTLDRLLPKETRNLGKINRIAERVNAIFFDQSYLYELKEKLRAIKTKEHKDKVELRCMIIDAYVKGLKGK